jgi:hypothetical protein
MTALLLTFADRAALEREHATNLVHGRAFVPNATDHALFSRCVLVLQHPECPHTLEIASEVVMVMADGPLKGTALQFCERGETMLASLRAFVAATSEADQQDQEARAEDDEFDDELDDDALDDAEREEGADPARRDASQLSKQRAQKLRNLSVTDRIRVAQGSVLEDRVLLERIYGSSVWEMLLRNPKITVPEVARMARKGTLPRPLLEVIADNEQWIRQSIVRRALLSNPRIHGEAAARILRTIPARELKLVPQQTAYPAIVRQTAQRLLRGT